MKDKIESKAERFIRVATARVEKALVALEKVENCSNRNTYEFSESQTAAIFAALDNALTKIKAAYAKKEKGKRKRFSLSEDPLPGQMTIEDEAPGAEELIGEEYYANAGD